MRYRLWAGNMLGGVMALVIRTIAAVTAAILLAGMVIAAAETIGHALQAGRGSASFISALAGYGIGALVGGATAFRFAVHKRVAAWTVVGVLALLAIINLFSFTHPFWFAPVAAVLFISAGWLVTRQRAT